MFYSSESVSTHIFRGKAMIMALLIGAAVITLIVIALGIIAVVRVRRSANGATLLHDATDQPQAAATLFHDEECMGCCDEDCCDEMLLTSTGTSVTNSNQLHHQIYQNGSKGPPDIIPSFGYNGEMDKNYDSYGKKSISFNSYLIILLFNYSIIQLFSYLIMFLFNYSLIYFIIYLFYYLFVLFI